MSGLPYTDRWVTFFKLSTGRPRAGTSDSSIRKSAPSIQRALPGAAGLLIHPHHRGVAGDVRHSRHSGHACAPLEELSDDPHLKATGFSPNASIPPRDDHQFASPLDFERPSGVPPHAPASARRC